MADVVILGAGPAGLGAALGLARKGCDVTVLERSDRVGGNAGSFTLAGIQVDYGSHRFHPAADPAVFALIRDLLGDDLLVRPRHGRIRLMGRWIHFPLRPIDLAIRCHPMFAAGVFGDLLRKAIAGSVPHDRSGDTFASVLERGLGSTICRQFYFPYAREIWGLDPSEISPVQAYKRVSTGSIGGMLRRLMPRGAGTGARSRKGVFYYPRRGYGQISERLREAAERAGARILLKTSARAIELRPTEAHRIETESAGVAQTLAARHIWSTIPITALPRLVQGAVPPDVMAAAAQLRLRAMVLVYLVLQTDQFTEFDAHYFPGEDLPFTRVSEPKNYAGVKEPAGVTVLCAEIPCERNDEIWRRPDDELGALVAEGLARSALPVRCPILDVRVERLAAAYPIYSNGYEAPFVCIDRWVDGLDRVLSFGRQGLYAHDNTHHALFMAQAAVDSLNNGTLDRDAWHRYREVFEGHVVED